MSKMAITALGRSIGYAAIAGYHDYRRRFTWKSWLFGWMLRLIAQVIFFSSLGVLLRSQQLEMWIGFGNAAALGPLSTLGVVASTARERSLGTLQYLILARTGAVAALASRGLYWAVDGFITSAIVLALLPLLVQLPMDIKTYFELIFMEVLLTLSTYCFSLALAGLGLRRMETRSFLTMGSTVLMLVLGGVTAPVPQGFFGVAAQTLPITPGIAAMRHIVEGKSGAAATEIMLEISVAALWGIVAWLSLGATLRAAVRNGNLSPTT